ncbi:MAG: hypothetical protein JSV68_21490 [Anaerolineaceae bacterium]|nr:MAG: hypothetical protein JSV68_21490 [Anaerolineaceae bacterium]
MQTRPNHTVPILPTLQLPDEPNVFVAGDLAAFEQAARFCQSYFTFERMVRLILPNRLIDEEQQVIEAAPYKSVGPEFVNE